MSTPPSPPHGAQPPVPPAAHPGPAGYAAPPSVYGTPLRQQGAPPQQGYPGQSQQGYPGPQQPYPPHQAHQSHQAQQAFPPQQQPYQAPHMAPNMAPNMASPQAPQQYQQYGVPQQQIPAQGNPFAPQTQPQMHPHQQPYGGMAPVGAGGAGCCELCGAAPARRVTVRGHQGMLVIMRFLKRQGTFCRTCGLAVFREMQSDTMVQGWWGMASAFITPLTLLINLFTLATIRNIPAPAALGWRPPADPGKSVMLRPAALFLLLPLVLIIAIATSP